LPVRRDNFEQPKQRFFPKFRHVPAGALAAQPNAQNAPAQVLWEIGATLAVWLLVAFIVELLFAAAR
jgi:hypothetical protein